MQETISDHIMEQQLKWIRHVGRMDEQRLSKRMLFEELRKKRPCHGMNKRLRDVAKLNMEAIGVGGRWYELCEDKGDWFKLCCEGLGRVSETRQRNECPANNQSQPSNFQCTCRSFCRQEDLTRHLDMNELWS